MKELTEKEKAQRYDETIKRIQSYVVDEYGCTRIKVVDVFPELKESEGERMIQYFKDLAPFDKAEELYEKYGFSHKYAIAWLEKQVEPSPIFSNSLNIGKVEQKPTDKIEPKFKVGNKIKLAIEPKYPAREIIAIQNDAYYFDEAIYLPFSRQDEWELVEQKQTWSEEDEAMLAEISDLLWESYKQSGSKFSWNDIRNWVNLRLKSLRPQSHWKPSNEEVEALEKALKYFHMSKAHGETIDGLKELLEQLLEQLKKLMEE